MADDDDLRINTLHRFAKRSPRLVLEEYSHCEVPAGCGGVVLRWIDPGNRLPARLRVRGLQASVWLDGGEVATERTWLAPGPHVLAIELVTQELAVLALDFCFAGAERERGREIVAPWRRGPSAPPDGWTAAAFDDRRWRPAPRATGAQIAALAVWARRAADEAIARGQHPIAVAPGRTYVRAHVEAAP